MGPGPTRVGVTKYVGSLDLITSRFALAHLDGGKEGKSICLGAVFGLEVLVVKGLAAEEKLT